MYMGIGEQTKLDVALNRLNAETTRLDKQKKSLKATLKRKKQQLQEAVLKRTSMNLVRSIYQNNVLVPSGFPAVAANFTGAGAVLPPGFRFGAVSGGRGSPSVGISKGNLSVGASQDRPVAVSRDRGPGSHHGGTERRRSASDSDVAGPGRGRGSASDSDGGGPVRGRGSDGGGDGGPNLNLSVGFDSGGSPVNWLR